MVYQIVIDFMTSKSKDGRLLLIHFRRNVVTASRESLFLYKNEKDALGFQAFPCKKSKVEIPFLKTCKAFC